MKKFHGLIVTDVLSLVFFLGQTILMFFYSKTTTDNFDTSESGAADVIMPMIIGIWMCGIFSLFPLFSLFLSFIRNKVVYSIKLALTVVGFMSNCIIFVIEINFLIFDLATRVPMTMPMIIITIFTMLGLLFLILVFVQLVKLLSKDSKEFFN